MPALKVGGRCAGVLVEGGGLAFDGAADEVAMSHAAYFFCRPSFLAGVGQADTAPRSWPRRGCARYRSPISGVVEPGRTTSPLWSFQQVGPTISHPQRAEGSRLPRLLRCAGRGVGALEEGTYSYWMLGAGELERLVAPRGRSSGRRRRSRLPRVAHCHASSGWRWRSPWGRWGDGSGARPSLSRLVTMLTSCLEAGAKGLRRSMTAGEEGTRACQSKLPRFSPGLIVDICTDCSTSDGTMECEVSEWGAFESAERSRRDPLHHALA